MYGNEIARGSRGKTTEGGGERMVGLEKLPDGTIEKRFASVNDCLAMDT